MKTTNLTNVIFSDLCVSTTCTTRGSVLLCAILYILKLRSLEET